MTNQVLLIGNGVNNLSNKQSWENLLTSTTKICKVSSVVDTKADKPFPLLYEEIYLKSKSITELNLKKHIANEVKKITENEIHALIGEKGFNHIITTNYEYSLQKGNSNTGNLGIIKESKFSVFRHNKTNNTKVWHIHGECNVPASITLGYEHYSGQLQQMRNYVVSGTHYTKKKNQKSLSSRLKYDKVTYESWIDLFFKKNIHIIGLALDFVEYDLWWLLTYRARFKKIFSRKVINKIYYYTPQKYAGELKQKTELLKSVGVEIVVKNKSDFPYYQEVINQIE